MRLKAMAFLLLVVTSLLSSAMAANNSNAILNANKGQIINANNNAMSSQAAILEMKASSEIDDKKAFDDLYNAAKLYAQDGIFSKAKQCAIDALDRAPKDVDINKKTILSKNKTCLEAGDVNLSW